MGNVRVEKVESLGGGNSLAHLTDGTYSCSAFSDESGPKVGETLEGALHAHGARAARVSDDHLPSLERDSSPFGHWIVGRISQLFEGTVCKEGSVTIGGFRVEDVVFPGDAEIGTLVEFSVDRLDILD